jgi:cytochrome c1
MAKNIDNFKISRVAKTKSTQCHSYSGATIQHLEEKIKEHWSDDRQNHEEVIIHTETNNLVNESPHQVAERMESLIQVAKIHSSDVRCQMW